MKSAFILSVVKCELKFKLFLSDVRQSLDPDLSLCCSLRASRSGISTTTSCNYKSSSGQRARRESDELLAEKRKPSAKYIGMCSGANDNNISEFN